LIEKLTRFTPTSATIDRETMLFAAGRASALGQRWWKIAVTILAISQCATLALWLASGRAPQSTSGAEAISDPRIPAEYDLPPSQPVELTAGNSCGEMLRQWEKSGSLPSPSAPEPAPPQQVLSIGTSYKVLTTD
jgi:hypothetical protein